MEWDGKIVANKAALRPKVDQFEFYSGQWAR
jgi:hypothetical protein